MFVEIPSPTTSGPQTSLWESMQWCTPKSPRKMYEESMGESSDSLAVDGTATAKATAGFNNPVTHQERANLFLMCVALLCLLIWCRCQCYLYFTLCQGRLHVAFWGKFLIFSQCVLIHMEGIIRPLFLGKVISFPAGSGTSCGLIWRIWQGMKLPFQKGRLRKTRADNWTYT